MEKKVIIDSHSRGSERSHNKRKKGAKENGRGKGMSQEVFDREVAELKESVNAIIVLLEKSMKDQNYGWNMRRNKINWKLLLKQTNRRMYLRLRKELKTVELEMQDDYYRPEQEDFFAKKEIIDEFLNYWTSSYQRRDVMIETSKKDEPSIFETNYFCMYAGDEQYLQDVFMQVTEEMKMLEEVTVMEQFMIEHVFKDTKERKMLTATMEAGSDDSSEIWQRNDKQSEDKRRL